MLVYRITKSKYADDISGNGASSYPGRWNKKGTRVLYTGSTKEIALLETIVHLPPMMSPSLDILTIEVPNDSSSEYLVSDLPANWAHFPAPTILSDMGQKWIEELGTLYLKVPSSIIHSSINVIINCQHPRFEEVKLIDRRPFNFDSRLKL